MKKVLFAVLLCVAMQTHAFGFATIVQSIKGGDEITFTSNVSDMDVYLNGQMIGKYSGSAFSYKIKRDGTPKVFTFKKQGFKPIEVTLTTTFDNMFFGNIFFSGTLGSSTDSWFTKNTEEYSPTQFFIQLEKS